MRILPAIDLLGGRAVRLHKGRYDEVTVYSTDPPEVARRFRLLVDRLHVVDLDGARDGHPVQKDLVRRIAADFAGGELQVGGGVRTRESLEGYVALGARRVVLGTAAAEQPDLVRVLSRAHPNVIVLAVDAKDGFVATHGWTNLSKKRAIDVVGELAGEAIAAVLYTDVSRDGTRIGPNLEATAELAAQSPFPVIASGGVGALEHVRALAALDNVESAVVGRALYDGSFTLAEAVAAASG